MKRILAAMAALIMILSLCACATEEPAQTQDSATEETLGVAYPTLMTYEEYKKLSPELQQAYYETFPDAQTYMQWFNDAVQAHNQTSAGEGTQEVTGNEGQITQPTEPETPATQPNSTNTEEDPTIPTHDEKSDNKVDGNAGQTTQPTQTITDNPETPATQPNSTNAEEKDPVVLTYEEYIKLTPAQQQAYYESFSSADAYMQWFNQAIKEYNQNNEESQETSPVEEAGSQTGSGLIGSASQGEVDF